MRFTILISISMFPVGCDSLRVEKDQPPPISDGQASARTIVADAGIYYPLELVQACPCHQSNRR